jgi:choline-sulfatase
VLAAIAGCARSPQRPDILLITIDTLRADHVGAYGARDAQGSPTPAIDALAARGVRFEHAQTSVPLTGPSHATILTGQYPPTHGVRGNVVFSLGAQYPTAADRLKRVGYHTAAFVAAYPVAAAFGFSQGFDTFDESFHETAPGEQGAERRGSDVSDAALRWLADAPRPFFLWLHYYDPHAPYDPPEPFRARFAGRPYDGEIAFADQQVGRVLDALRASGRDGATVVALLADHGEGLGDHDEQTHGVLIYESTMHVPFVIAGPAIASGRAVSPRVGTIDLLPTLLGYAGAAPDRALPGRDLRPLLDVNSGRTIPSDPLYAESLFGRLNMHWAALRGWTEGNFKLVAGPQPELYDLAADPGERHDLAASDPTRAARMRDQLTRAMTRLAPGGDRAQTNPISAEQEQRLRSLGYTAGSGGSGPLDDPRLPNPRTHVALYDRLQAASVARGAAVARAFADVQAIAKDDPGNPFAFGTLASMAYRFGSLQLAAAAFARAIELDPDRPGVRQNYGKLLRELDRYADSERQLRLALAQAGGDDDRTRINLAETLVASGKTDEALQEIDAVLRRDSQDAEALVARARLRLREGRAAEALGDFDQAAARSAEPEIFIERAEAALASGNRARARDAADEALRRNPGHPWALSVVARLLAADGQRAAAAGYLQRALAAGPRRPAVWRSLAAAFDTLGDERQAAACRRNASAAAGAGRAAS